MSIALMAWVSVPPRPSQKRVLVEDLGRPFGFDGRRAAIERLELGERGADEVDVGERAAVADRAFLGHDRDERVDRILGPELLAPAALGRGAVQADRHDLADPHRWASTGRAPAALGRTPYLRPRVQLDARRRTGRRRRAGRSVAGSGRGPGCAGSRWSSPGASTLIDPGRPVAEEARLAMRRLDDDGVEVARVLAVGEEQRAVVEHDRPAGGDDRHRARSSGPRSRPTDHSRPSASLVNRPSLSADHVSLERHRLEPPRIEPAADRRPEPCRRRPAATLAATARASTIGARTVPAVAAVGEGAQDRVAVARRARARRIGGVGQDDRPVVRRTRQPRRPPRATRAAAASARGRPRSPSPGRAPRVAARVRVAVGRHERRWSGARGRR